MLDRRRRRGLLTLRRRHSRPESASVLVDVTEQEATGSRLDSRYAGRAMHDLSDLPNASFLLPRTKCLGPGELIQQVRCLGYLHPRAHETLEPLLAPPVLVPPDRPVRLLLKRPQRRELRVRWPSRQHVRSACERRRERARLRFLGPLLLPPRRAQHPEPPRRPRSTRSRRRQCEPAAELAQHAREPGPLAREEVVLPRLGKLFLLLS